MCPNNGLYSARQLDSLRQGAHESAMSTVTTWQHTDIFLQELLASGSFHRDTVNSWLHKIEQIVSGYICRPDTFNPGIDIFAK